jgi:plastocyanin
MRKSVLLTIIIIALIAIGGAIALTHKSSYNTPSRSSTSSYSSNTNQTANQTPQPGNVEIKNMMFTPSQISVSKGAKVTWTNNDNTAHTVIDDLSNVGGPSSGTIEPGGTYSFTFTKSGSYQYHCNIHPSMRGTIVVK